MQLSRRGLTSAEQSGRFIFLFLFLMQNIVIWSSRWQQQVVVAGHVCLNSLCLEKAAMKSLTLITVVQFLSGYYFCMELIIRRRRFLRTSRQNPHFSNFSLFLISLTHLGVWRLHLYFQMYYGRSRQAMRAVRVLNPIIFQCKKHRRFTELEKNNVLHIFLSFLIRL